MLERVRGSWRRAPLHKYGPPIAVAGVGFGFIAGLALYIVNPPPPPAPPPPPVCEARDDRGKYAHEPAPFWIRSFVRHFREHLWPAERLPELYCDPRALRPEPHERAILHAKCVVVDDARAFISSANFSQAGHERNIEAGVVVEDPALARQLTAQFDALVQAGAVERVVLE